MFDFAAVRGSGDGEKEPMTTMGFLDHLEELRKRIVYSIVAVAVGFGVCWWKVEWLYGFMQKPIVDVLRKHGLPEKLVFLNPTDPFNLYLKVAGLAGLFLTSPFVLYQVWMFISPGLYRNEKRFAVPLLVSAILLFYVGVTFAYFFVFPVMFSFFASTTPKGVSMMTDINSYLDFVLVMFFAFGAAFEVPVAVVLLVITGIVKLQKLRENRGYVLLGIFIFAAMLTPPDAVSQSILAVPMYLLYEGGLLMARILQHMKSKEIQPAK